MRPIEAHSNPDPNIYYRVLPISIEMHKKYRKKPRFLHSPAPIYSMNKNQQKKTRHIHILQIKNEIHHLRFLWGCFLKVWSACSTFSPSPSPIVTLWEPLFVVVVMEDNEGWVLQIQSRPICWKKLMQDLYLFSCISNIKQINTR